MAPGGAPTYSGDRPRTRRADVAACRAAGRIVAVERDPALADALQDVVPETVEVVEQDILAHDLTEWARRLRRNAPRDVTLRIAGNLPYSVSSPILAMVLRSARAARFRDAVLMLQREVADRVVAGPERAITVHWHPHHASCHRTTRIAVAARRVPAAAAGPFDGGHARLPRPGAQAPDPARFDALVRQLFTRRRKQLVNTLPSAEDRTHHDPARICQAAGIDPTRRPGTLSLSELIDLDAALAATRR